MYFGPILAFVFLYGTLSKSHDFENGNLNTKGLFPKAFNLASSSIITVNATCGQYAPEVYCKLVEHVLRGDDLKRADSGDFHEAHCGICDSLNADKYHPISNAIDGTNRWWQSPTLQNGKKFEWITITLDLGQIYQVAYVIIKAAISPRPGNWILERSLDGLSYKPWQYYALSESMCWEAYGIRPTIGKPKYRSDEEVICTSYYSKLNPLENGEIHTSLINGRSGADGPSLKLREFTKARYVRLRLQKIRTLNADLMTLYSNDSETIDKHVTRRYFYSIKDISIGGHCMCSGHAANCSYDRISGKQYCKCEHNTCGENCEKCCPLYNQKAFKSGTIVDAAACTKCECFGHSESCHFDQNIASRKASINTEGEYDGGGVCDNCMHHTTGVNCEQCIDGYFRPTGVSKDHTEPCKKCQCINIGMTGSCIKDDSYTTEGLKPGHCLCKVSFEGKNCDCCAKGYKNFPTCEPCPCHSAGTLNETCDGVCTCKLHVEGPQCDRCKHGFYHLSADNPDGCSQCFCFGLTDECMEGDWGIRIIENIEDWKVTDIDGMQVVKPLLENKEVVIANDDMTEFGSYYYIAPSSYLGNKLLSYGADLKFKVSYVIARGDTSGSYTESADVILEGNGERLGYNWSKCPEADSISVQMPLREQNWFILSPSIQHTGSVSREEFTLVLNNITRLLIRAKFHTDQIEGRLYDVSMEIASKDSKSLKKLKSVEKCLCPPGYAGTSCERCTSGYREMKNSTSLVVTCQRCDCYNHAEFCEFDSGHCINCLHHTTGLKCNQCVQGFYGNATIGNYDDCKPCACPLEQTENNFSPSCHAVDSLTNENDYICDHCPQGYTGDKCERCSEGYFGNPQIPGGYCQPCECNGNADTSSPGWCDNLTGQCRKCLGNTGGWNCDECLFGNSGDTMHHLCIPCKDECIRVLLHKLYEIELELNSMNLTNVPNLPWRYLNKITKAEHELLPHVQRYQKELSAGKELLNNLTLYFDLEAYSDDLILRVSNFTKNAITISSTAKSILNEVKKLLLKLNKIWKDIKGLTSELDKHGLYPIGPVDRVLTEAEKILHEIQNQNFISHKDDFNGELWEAQNLLDRIRKLAKHHEYLGSLQEQMDNFQKITGDIVKKINDYVQETSEKAKETVQDSQLRQKGVKGNVEQISGFIDFCSDTLKEASGLLGSARSLSTNASAKFEYLHILLSDLNNVAGTLDEYHGSLALLNPMYSEKYIIPAQANADHLEQESQHLAELFTVSKKFSLQVAEAYQNLIDAIHAAEKAAQALKKAADRVYYEAYPGTDGGLLTNANETRSLSLKLLLEAQHLNEGDIAELKVLLTERKKNLDKLSEVEVAVKRNNSVINKGLDAVEISTEDVLAEASIRSETADKNAEKAYAKITLLQQRIDDKLKLIFEAIQTGSIEGLEKLTAILQQTREDIRSASQLVDSANTSAGHVRRRNEELQLNLMELKAKVLLARQKSSSIRMALTTDISGNCMRSYKPSIQPSTTNSIVLNFAINNNESNSSIFYLGSVKKMDFMAIEMVNRKIRFLWNVGGGSQVIEHNMTIESNNDQLSRSEQWYKIEANRISNLGALSVKRSSESQKADTHEISGASPAGYTKMDLDETSRLFIGGLLKDYARPTELQTSKFSGCLYEVLLDGKPIGLWDFATNIGCGGCQEGSATEDIDISAYEFQGGSSYAIVPQNPYYRKKDLYIVLNFRTLNEDGLLFLSSNERNGDFMAIELRSGKVVYQLKFGDGQSHILFQTKNTYNTGEWIRVDAAREKFNAQMLVNQEFLEAKSKKQNSFLLDLKESALYYGGIPPNFTRWPEITFKSFFGCMRDLQIDSTTIALSQGSHYGMTVGCLSKPLRVATFLGDGFLELNSQHLPSDSSFSFTFLTHQRDSLLLLSGELKKADDMKEIMKSYYFVALKDGRIEARFNIRTHEILLMSDYVLSGGTFHTVNIVRKNRRLLLRIDDADAAEIRLPKGAKDIEAPKVGGLFFGGVKMGIDLEHMRITTHPFVGIVQDVIFNEKLLRFEDALEFHGVDFGVTNIKDVLQGPFQQMAVSSTLNNDSCATSDFDVEDAWVNPAYEQSYQKLQITKGNLLKSFNITFEFQTHYSDGILLFAKTHMEKQEFILYLKNSSVNVKFKGKNRHMKQPMISKHLETGNWHKIELLKSGLGLNLFIDDKLTASFDNIKRLGLKSPLYIGGTPKHTHAINIVPIFHGCIKYFYLNDMLQKFSSTTSCFKTSVSGNYFTGSSYVTYNSAFYLTDAFAIDISFRTSQIDADILYIYSSTVKLWLGIKIRNGQVLGTVFSESDFPKIELSCSLQSRYAVCNNQWHHINFSYKHRIFSLKLDNQEAVNKKIEKPFAELNYAEIFVGGFPKNRLKGLNQPFKGCLQALAINHKNLDFRNAENISDMLFFCPES